MTAILNEPVTGIGLVYKELVLDTNRDAMVRRLVEVHHIGPPRAAAMIDQWWHRLVNRLIVDYAHKGMDRPLAERIQNEAFGYLRMCALTSDAYGPSSLVDEGWHNAVLYTLEYDALSYALAGRFLHHVPTDLVGFHLVADVGESKCGGGKCQSTCSDTKCHGKADTVPCGDAARYLVSQSDSTCESGKCGNPCHTRCEGDPRRAAYPDGQCPDGVATLKSRKIADTVAAMRLLGPVDEALWQADGDKCTKCTGCDDHGKCTVKCEGRSRSTAATQELQPA